MPKMSKHFHASSRNQRRIDNTPTLSKLELCRTDSSPTDNYKRKVLSAPLDFGVNEGLTLLGQNRDLRWCDPYRVGLSSDQ